MSVRAKTRDDMSNYKPQTPFNVPAQILKGEYAKVNGINSKTFADGPTIWVSAKSYGGTEKEVNDKIVIVDTLSIETWYRPDITAADGIRLLDDGSEWEILNTPENIERRNQWLKFKVQRMKGGA